MQRSPETNELRFFGITWVAVLALIALLPLLHQAPIRFWALLIATILLVTALVIPAALTPFFYLWSIIGKILGQINTQIVLVLMFYLIITPIGMLRKLGNRDPLKYRFELGGSTYWQNRIAQPGSMRKQY